jgi:hypothetical protein
MTCLWPPCFSMSDSSTHNWYLLPQDGYIFQTRKQKQHGIFACVKGKDSKTKSVISKRTDKHASTPETPAPPPSPAPARWAG